MPTRRHALRAGGVVAAALAGCLGSLGVDRTTTVSHDSCADHPACTTTTPDGPDALRWTLDTDGEMTTPVVAHGTVYAPSRALYAVAADGTERWRFEADVPVQSRPLVRDSGVYVVTGSFQGSPAGEKFASHALAPDGSERWTHHPDHGMVSVLAATPDAAFVGTHDDHLQKEGESLSALDAADGDRRWEVGIGDANDGVVVEDTVVASYRLGVAGVDIAGGVVQWRASAESLGGTQGDAVVLVGQSDVRALAVADGSERWTFERAGEPSAVTVADGTVYVSADDGTLYALDAASGEERWRASFDSEVGRLAVGGDAVYAATFGEANDRVTALDVGSGETRWQFDTEHDARLAATADGAYVTLGESLQALASDGTERWRYEADARLTRPVVDADGVYVGDRGGTLAALDA